MVLASRMLFRIPQSETWYDNLDSIHCSPSQPVEVKEIIGHYPNNWKHKSNLGMIPLNMARVKYT